MYQPDTNDDFHAHLVNTARAADLSSSDRAKLWKTTYENSAPLEREFESLEQYSAFMEGLYTGRVRLRKHGKVIGG